MIIKNNKKILNLEKTEDSEIKDNDEENSYNNKIIGIADGDTNLIGISYKDYFSKPFN